MAVLASRENSRLPERRYDHIYVSDHFTVLACRYPSEWLHGGRSDHAAVEAEIAFTA
jgi:endonuclease/exonuclease/phosphatase family metal-dependent hydrolase